MLATLNLQLSPVELLDGNTLAPVSAGAAETGETASGFADLLRLRVDASLLADDAGGELLPEGGSGLPILAELASIESGTDLLPAPKIDAGLVKLTPAPIDAEGLKVQDEAVDLLLETPVLYPPPSTETGADSAGLIIAPVPSGGLLPNAKGLEPPRPDAGIEARPGVSIESQLKLNIGPATPVPPPVVDGRGAQAQSLVAAASVLAPLSVRERGQPSEPTSRAAPFTVGSTILDADGGAQLTDVARRIDLSAMQRLEPATDALQSRAAVTQTLQAQISPQPSQPTLSLAPASSAAPETGYAAAAQLNTDLIGTSVRDRGWGEQVGDRVLMMAANQLKQAEIRLSPAELGPLRVQVSVDDGKAHVTFHAPHAVTREALEQAMPRLREMLAENGLSLGQADVSDRGVGEGGRDADPDGRTLNSRADEATDVDLGIGPELSQRATISNGLVDTFA